MPFEALERDGQGRGPAMYRTRSSSPTVWSLYIRQLSPGIEVLARRKTQNREDFGFAPKAGIVLLKGVN